MVGRFFLFWIMGWRDPFHLMLVEGNSSNTLGLLEERCGWSKKMTCGRFDFDPLIKILM
jgi:hypothetical protein